MGIQVNHIDFMTLVTTYVSKFINGVHVIATIDYYVFNKSYLFAY